MKNKASLFLMGLILCCLLTSCGVPKPPQEDDIMQDIPDEITTIQIGNPFDRLNMYVYDLDVTSVSIQKRQTNDKEDVVYCAVELENEYYQFTKHLCLNYNYYDEGGWILDDYGEYDATEWSVIKCSLNVEDVAYICNYPKVEFKETVEDLEHGAISYCFDIEDPHANGSYKGTVVVDCQFDGQEWSYTKNTDDVVFLWDILGTWEYKKDEAVASNASIKEMEVSIQGFDRSSLDMNGSWHMRCESSLLGIHAETMISLDNPERVRIGVDGDMIELWEDPNHNRMHSYVRFYPDEVEAAYAGALQYFGPIKLERIAAPDTTTEDDMNTWNKMIKQYFAMMETGDIEAISITESVYDDNITGEPIQQYTITEIEHSNTFYQDTWEELSPYLDNFELTDAASVHIQAKYANPEIDIVDFHFNFFENSGVWQLLEVIYS